MPGQQSFWGDWEDSSPVTSRDQRGQRGEPQAVGRFVADPARDLAAEHGVLMTEYEQLGILEVIAVQYHGRDGQEHPGQLVEQ